ncbi:unnamed protein product [Peronospora belbahrii]|uniref:SCA7 domain-containing protein n=1 Tax=Peronospora belbahrii TaxID=622444 RepID=A0AAU9L8Q7_9STRA|nr:unnamed protein product [Peronospora belbahrii]CAH0521406.1 unnamed protein product [Peronospora belbahrii]
MSNVKASSVPVLPGSERPDYRGKCLYKTGKCLNERALKTSGTAHNLCNEHRNRQNRHQRKLDAKNRLYKQERRVSTKENRKERLTPYRRKKHQSLETSVALSDDTDSGDNIAAFPATSPPAAAAAADATVDGVPSVPSTTQATGSATSGNGIMLVSNKSPVPQMANPFVLQDFDGIVVPLPSYLEGPERIEFRSRIYQKVLDFISEECILRFGAKVDSTSVDASTATDTAPITLTSSSNSLKTEPQSNSEEYAPTSSNDHLLAASTSHVQQSTLSATEKSKTTNTTKKVH